MSRLDPIRKPLALTLLLGSSVVQAQAVPQPQPPRPSQPVQPVQRSQPSQPVQPSQPAQAAQPSAADAPFSLSLAETLRRGEQFVPLLVKARNEELIVQAKRAGAAMILPQNPYATFLGGYRRETTSSPTATGFQYQVHVEQLIEVAGQRGTRLESVAAQLAVARAGSDHARTLTRALLQSTYTQAGLAEQRVLVAKDREEIAQRLLQSARVRQEVGAASEIEVNLAQVEAGRVVGERVQAETRREEVLGELRLLCGLPPLLPLHLSSPSDPPLLPVEYQDLGRLIAIAESGRADYQGLLRQRDVHQKERSRLIREAVPSPVLALDVQRDLPGQEFYGGTLGMYLPVWNRNQGPLAQIRAAETARQREQPLLQARIHSEVAVAQRKLLMLRQQVQEFQKTVVPPAERTLELLRRGWQAGKFDLYRVIVASRELAETRMRYIDLVADLWSATIELERSVGAPILTGDLR